MPGGAVRQLRTSTESDGRGAEGGQAGARGAYALALWTTSERDVHRADHARFREGKHEPDVEPARRMDVAFA